MLWLILQEYMIVYLCAQTYFVKKHDHMFYEEISLFALK